MTLFSLQSDRVALIDADAKCTVTYRDLKRWEEALRPLLPSAPALWFLFAQNGWQEIAAYVALLNAGQVVCLLDALLDDSLQTPLVERYRPHFILSQLRGEWSGYESFALPLENLKGAKRRAFEEAPPLHPDLRLLLSTSGTTGSPKMIRLSSRNILSNAQAIVDYLGIKAKERAVASLPIHYSYGLSVLHTHLLAGATTILTRASVMQAPFWEAVRSYRATSFAGVPFTYEMLDRIGFEELELPDLKTMTQAGGALDKGLILKFHRHMQQKGGRFFVMYGQTEATARIAYLPSDRLPEKAGSIGRAIPGCTLKLYEGEALVAAPQTKGELVLEGPNVMLGYAQQPEDLRKGDEMRGILHTGDLAYRDEEGFYYLTGRLKRISKVYGSRINLDEIESFLRPFATVAVTSDDRQITLHLEGSSQEGGEPCIKRLATHYHLHESTFTCRRHEQLPRTASGKIDYAQLERP